ncbi:MAG: hypothetical protein ABFS56_26320 [Pseudomonadota bacterium]
MKDQVLDQVMSWHSDFVPVLANNREMQRMALFDIDKKTFREWGSPVLTPRDKQAALMSLRWLLNCHGGVMKGRIIRFICFRVKGLFRSIGMVDNRRINWQLKTQRVE